MAFSDCPLAIDSSFATQNATGLAFPALGVVRPVNEAEVTALVRYAREEKIALYPISTGRNWGYGSASAMRDRCLIVDLGQMRAIRQWNPETGIITLEPGVSQSMLYEFLQSHGGEYLVPTTGAGPNCSIVGNALERGFGITPYCDHFGAVMSLRAVLPNGKLYTSMFQEHLPPGVQQSFKWGVGPYLDGLFSQGGFGIVTEMTLSLAPKPEAFEAFFFSLRSASDITAAVEIVRSILKEYGALVGGINLMNDLRVLSMVASTSETEIPRSRALTMDELNALKDKQGVAPWTGMGTLYGTAETVRAARKALRRRLKKRFSRVIFLNEAFVKRIKAIAKFVPHVRKTALYAHLLKAETSLKILSGVPSQTALPLAFWRSGGISAEAASIEIDQPEVGLLWYSPIIPLESSTTVEVAEMIRRVCRRYEIDPLTTLTAFHHTCFDCTVPLIFDRRDAESVRRAHDCYAELVAEGRKLGAAPYRTGIQGLDLTMAEKSVAAEWIEDMKALTDPDRIVAPRRYSLR
ncbi:MAG: FAD-binding oxidoreductase [Bdellovibrionales bacterium]|nr:FAD-binding oxidoreductase [Bdellovibrionales bacterium]